MSEQPLMSKLADCEPSDQQTQQQPQPNAQLQQNMQSQPNIITVQPQTDGKTDAPKAAPRCSLGLECLTELNQLLVHQKVELCEVFTGVETNNSYTIKNASGEKMFWALEDNDCFSLCCCGSLRSFEMKIRDAFKEEVIHLSRPFACQSCCFPCCLQSMEVSSPPGNVIGSIEQQWTLWVPSFLLKDQSGERVLRIEGPFFTTSICCGDVDFEVYTMNGHQVGKISKQWSGLLKERCTDADNLKINFATGLDVKMKAVLLGACFLIDFMFFES